MTLVILAAVSCGILFGCFFVPQEMLLNFDTVILILLSLLVFSVGIDIGSNEKVFRYLKDIGVRILLVPLSIVTGSIIGGVISGFLCNIPLNISLAIASGFGWYSLSGVMLSKLCGIEVGTVAFLANVFRELFAFLSISYLVRCFNKFTAIAVAGATSMDVTLPLIARETDNETSIVAFVNGMILSALVPVLITFFAGLR